MLFFNSYSLIDYVALTIDITLIWFISYRILIAARGTKAIQLIIGFLLIIALQGISRFFRLQTLESITRELITWGFLSIIIIFQPEIRRTLEELGRAKFLSRTSSEKTSEANYTIKELATSVGYMSKRHIGALITIERGTGLKEYVDTGISIQGNVSSQLLTNIFIPNSPLHDGAVIISGFKIAAAGCYLPLTENQSLPKKHGTRHRAAVGISETSDAITIIVSEETGEVSIAKAGVLHHDIDISNMESMLKLSLISAENKKIKKIFGKGYERNE